MNNTRKCNIINFLRGENQKNDIDYMLEPVKQQIELSHKYNLKMTFLMQYDALVDDRFVELLRNEIGENIEVGAWFETPKQLIEEAGLKWRDNNDVSWSGLRCDVGFIIGYSPDERKKIIDVYFKKFRNVWGYYPEVVGSWFIDSFSLDYMKNKYSIVASCVCREQVGTDAFTLCGGYFNGYYPSKNNMFCPASSVENQINVPTFRMLGDDVIYNYDYKYLVANMGHPQWMRKQNTMEPVSPNYGGKREWVEWYLKNQLDMTNAPFSYVQIGQENSFGWEKMGKGLEMQLEIISKMFNDGEICVEKLSETGKWYKENFSTTPSLCSVANSDWLANRKSFWYFNNNYRINVYKQGKFAWIRDLYYFNEKYKERYLSEACKENSCTYDNPPIVDGYVWSDQFTRAGIYPIVFSNEVAKPIEIQNVLITSDENTTKITLKTAKDDIEIICSDKIKIISSDEVVWQFRYAIPSSGDFVSAVGDGINAWNDNIVGWSKTAINYIHNSFEYVLSVEKGSISESSKKGSIVLVPDNGELIVRPIFK